jgi:hypothetical protein
VNPYDIQLDLDNLVKLDATNDAPGANSAPFEFVLPASFLKEGNPAVRSITAWY